MNGHTMMNGCMVGLALACQLFVYGHGLSAQVTGSPRVPTDPAVRVGRLSNGLRYYVRHNETPKGRAEFRLVINAGSILEDDDQRGLAHFTEHLAFNGSAHFPHQGIIDYLESTGMTFGSDLNAGTGYDETTYMLTMPTNPAVLDTTLLIMDDWAHGVTMDSAAVEKERGIIFEERRLHQGPGMRTSDLHAPFLLGSHYASRDPIGLGETIMHAPRSAIWRFYHDWYRPDLETVIAVGDFDVDWMVSRITARFGRIPARQSPRIRPAIHVIAHNGPVASVAADSKIADWSAEIAFPKSHDLDTVITEATIHRNVIDALFYDVLNNRLHALVMSKNSPVQEAFIGGVILGRNVPAYDISLAAREPTTLELGITAVQAEVARIARDGITNNELERARKLLIEQCISDTFSTNVQSSASLAQNYVKIALTGMQVSDPRAGTLIKLRFAPRITAADLQEVANTILATPGPVVMATVPKDGQYSLPDRGELLSALKYGADRTLPLYVDTVNSGSLLATVPAGGKIVHQRVIQGLGVTEWTLNNGAHVLLKPTAFDRDAFTIRAVSRGGTSVVADDNYPNASVASDLVNESGLDKYDRHFLQRRIDGQITGWGVRIDDDKEEAYVQGSPRHAGSMLQLMYLAFTSPRMDTAAVSRWHSEARHQQLDPFALEIKRATTQRNPRARPVVGPLADSVNADSALAFYKSRFADAGHFTFVIVGDFNVDSLRPLVERYLGSLPGRAVDSTGISVGARDLGIRPPSGIVQHSVVGSDSSSTTQIIFDAEMPYSFQESAVMQAMHAILAHRVRLRLREQMSGVYSPGVRFQVTNIPYGHATAKFSFTSDPGRAKDLQNALMAVIDTFTSKGITQEELQTARNWLRRTREVQAQSNDYWNSFLEDGVLQGQSLEDLSVWEQQVASVTSEMISASARRLFDKNRYVAVTQIPVRMAPVRRDELISAQQW
jgi:zinc protease